MSNLLSFTSVMKSLGGVALAVVILLAMVTIHEFGHYVAGKILGFKINEFSVGFGPAILKKRSKKTGELFALRVIPLGGYCAFDGEDEAEDAPKETPTEEPFAEMAETPNEGGMVESTEEKPSEEYPEPKGERFNNQPPWKRIIVLIAGATMNYLLALVLIISMFAFIGRPVYQIVKEEPKEGASQGAVQTYEEGLQTGDTVLKINGKTVYLITDWQSALDGKKKGEEVKVVVLRGGEKKTVAVTLYEDAKVKSMNDNNAIFYSLGIAYRETVIDESGNEVLKTTRGGALAPMTVKDGFFETLGNSFAYSWKIGGTVLRSLGELLTGKLGMDAVGGPITTIKVTSQAASSGWLSFLNIAALIGVNLAVFNLLPVPALDGCKVIFCIIEWIRKKPINRKVEAMIHFVGIIFLFGFAILVDLLQLF
nr:site-2 protease family protein [Clostridia bacterium]